MSEMVCMIGFEYVEVMTKEEFQRRLDEEYYGDAEFFSEPPKEKDPNCWGDKKLLIVGGKITVPQPEEKVTKWRI